MDGRRVEVVQLLATAFHARDQVRAFQDAQVLGHSLAAHASAFAKFAEGLPVTREKRVEQGPPALVGQGAENAVNCLVFGVHALLYATKRLHVNVCRPEKRLSYAALDGQNGRSPGHTAGQGVGCGGSEREIRGAKAMTRKHVIVIGAGFSGVAVAAAIARSKRARVTLVGRDGFGPGLAYATKDPSHLLNVRASNMSARADKPDDFALWLHSKTGAAPTTFASRTRYGVYAQDVLKRAQQAVMFSGGLKREKGDVVSCRAGSGWWNVTLASGKTFEANGVVLALGNQPVSRPVVFADANVPVVDAWNAKALQRIDRGDVLLLGAGLTMIDVALSLASRSRTQTIYALSRRGQTPRMHLDPPMPPPSTPLQLPTNLSDALHEFRREVRAMAERGEPWQLAVDRMRSVTPALWRALSLEQQRRFLRHLRVWWDVHRHRAAPEIFARAQELQNSGKLRVLGGEIISAERKGRQYEIYHRQRGSLARHRIEVAAVVNCTGSNLDLTRSTDPLIEQMLTEGLARTHATGLGLDLDHDARVLDARGQVQGSLYAIGPITAGSFWESTAVPEIRARAASISALI